MSVTHGFIGGLGRLAPPDQKHLALYSLSAETLPSNPESLVVGIDWTNSFDTPVEKTGADGQPEYWVGLDANNLGPVRGGHCICLPYDHTKDTEANWDFFRQGDTGCCVGFGWSRRQTLCNGGQFYDGFSLYDYTIKHDGDPSTNTRQDGTTVRAGGETLRTVGAWRADLAKGRNGRQREKVTGPFTTDGIEAYVWARSVDDMFAVLRNPLYQQRGAVPLVNSWGKQYPHVVWVPIGTWNHLLFERSGDCSLATDRPGGGKS